MRKICIHIPFANEQRHKVEFDHVYNNVSRICLKSYSIQFIQNDTKQPAVNSLFSSIDVGLEVLEGHVMNGRATATNERDSSHLKLPVHLGQMSTIEHPDLTFDLGGKKNIKRVVYVDVTVNPTFIHERYLRHHGGTVDDLFDPGSTQDASLVSSKRDGLQNIYTKYDVKADKQIFPSLNLWFVVNEPSPLDRQLPVLLSCQRLLQQLLQAHDRQSTTLRGHHLTHIQQVSALNSFLQYMQQSLNN